MKSSTKTAIGAARLVATVAQHVTRAVFAPSRHPPDTRGIVRPGDEFTGAFNSARAAYFGEFRQLFSFHPDVIFYALCCIGIVIRDVINYPQSVRASSSHSSSGTTALLVDQRLCLIHYLLMRNGWLRVRQGLFHFVAEPGVMRLRISR